MLSIGSSRQELNLDRNDVSTFQSRSQMIGMSRDNTHHSRRGRSSSRDSTPLAFGSRRSRFVESESDLQSSSSSDDSEFANILEDNCDDVPSSTWLHADVNTTPPQNVSLENQKKNNETITNHNGRKRRQIAPVGEIVDDGTPQARRELYELLMADHSQVCDGRDWASLQRATVSPSQDVSPSPDNYPRNQDDSKEPHDELVEHFLPKRTHRSRWSSIDTPEPSRNLSSTELDETQHPKYTAPRRSKSFTTGSSTPGILLEKSSSGGDDVSTSNDSSSQTSTRRRNHAPKPKPTAPRRSKSFTTGSSTPGILLEKSSSRGDDVSTSNNSSSQTSTRRRNHAPKPKPPRNHSEGELDQRNEAKNNSTRRINSVANLSTITSNPARSSGRRSSEGDGMESNDGTTGSKVTLRQKHKPRHRCDRTNKTVSSIMRPARYSISDFAGSSFDELQTKYDASNKSLKDIETTNDATNLPSVPISKLGFEIENVTPSRPLKNSRSECLLYPSTCVPQSGTNTENGVSGLTRRAPSIAKRSSSWVATGVNFAESMEVYVFQK